MEQVDRLSKKLLEVHLICFILFLVLLACCLCFLLFQNEKNMPNWLDHDLEVAVHIHEVRSSKDKQEDT